MQITFETSPVAALLQWNATDPSGNLVSSFRLRVGDGGWVNLGSLGGGADVAGELGV